jgi:hypothetical protein
MLFLDDHKKSDALHGLENDQRLVNRVLRTLWHRLPPDEKKVYEGPCQEGEIGARSQVSWLSI